jgi:hypothetical protein
MNHGRNKENNAEHIIIVLQQHKKKTCQSSRQGRKFQFNWLKEFSWLEYDSEVARCSVCSNFNMSNNQKVRHTFTVPLKVETFRFHGKSAIHTTYAEILHALLKSEETPLSMCVKKMEQEISEYLTVVFITAY